MSDIKKTFTSPMWGERMKRNTISPRVIIMSCITILVCAYIALTITNAFFPQPQFTIDLNDSRNITAYTYHNQGTAFPLEHVGDNHYRGQIPQGYWEKAYQLEIITNPETSRILGAEVNGSIVDSRSIVHIYDITGFEGELLRTVMIRVPEFTVKNVALFAAIFLCFLILSVSIKKELVGEGIKNVCSVLLYDGSALQVIGGKALVVAFIGIVATALIAVGCDIDVIIGDMNLYGSGVDIYQLEATINQRLQFELTMWSYNIPMLIFYFIGTLSTVIGKPFFNPEAYHIGYYLVYKILNGVLLMATVVSVLSFLLKHRYISEKSCKSAFFWSLFNPVTFYVAIIFVQLDAFPAYCLTLGILLLVEMRFPLLAGVLLGVGLSCKQQNYLLFPLVAFMIFYMIVKHGKKYCLSLLKFVTMWVVSLGVCLLPNFWGGTPMWLMGQYTPQSERAWWTTIQYAPSLFFLITPAVLVFIMIANLLHMDLRKTSEAVAINTLYMFGAIVLLFSFSIISTPSTLIQCMAAFTLCYAFSRDGLQRLMIGGLSILMVFEVMFSSVGDIFRLLGYWNFPYTFTEVEQRLAGTDEGIRYVSLLFTISHAAMLVYGMYFYRKACSSLRADLPNISEGYDDKMKQSQQ